MFLTSTSPEKLKARDLLDQVSQQALRAAVLRQHELMRANARSTGDAVITTDEHGNIIWLNPVAERLTGWEAEDARGLPVEHVIHIIDAVTGGAVADPIRATLASGAAATLAAQCVLVSRHGAEFGIEDFASPMRGADGRIFGAVVVFQDVTAQRSLAAEVRYRASHDALTGVINRAAFESRLRSLLEQARADASQHAVLFIDLDQCDMVNDVCGHAIGDRLLKQIAATLAQSVRARDTLARLGGDAFAIILEQCSAREADGVAQQLCNRMDGFRFEHDGARFHVGARVAVVALDASTATIESLLSGADTCRYAAGQPGLLAGQEQMQWAAKIEQALDEDGFVLYAQRIFSARAPAAGVDAEILVRMKSTDGALILPGAFLPAAERFNLSARIDRWVLKNLLHWMSMLPRDAAIGTLSVNLSAQSVGDRAFQRWAIGVLEEAGGATRARLGIEITEAVGIANLPDAAPFVEQLRGLGVKVALEDFGAGACSFGYLRTMAVDTLKIDGALIRRVLDDPLDEQAVKSFVAVAAIVEAKTVAPHVESEDVRRRLCELGIDYVQGYLLHRPAPIAELTDI